MTVRSLFSLLALAPTLAVAACGGGNDERSAAAVESSAPEQAISEIGHVRSGLDDALAAVKAGHDAKAEEILSESYVEHFEKVEGPLEKVDRELKEGLEATLSTKLRDKVHSGAPAAAVGAMIADAKRDLDTAKAKLEP